MNGGDFTPECNRNHQSIYLFRWVYFWQIRQAITFQITIGFTHSNSYLIDRMLRFMTRNNQIPISDLSLSDLRCVRKWNLLHHSLFIQIYNVIFINFSLSSDTHSTCPLYLYGITFQDKLHTLSSLCSYQQLPRIIFKLVAP